MVKSTILTIDPDIAYHAVRATRGKAVRAEPIASRHERGMIHFVGSFDALEDELCTWIAGRSSSSPNRLDAFVWAMTDLAHEGWSVWGGRDADEHTKKADISGSIAEHGVFWPSS
jgi:phage terminase large subunit-like protein